MSIILHDFNVASSSCGGGGVRGLTYNNYLYHISLFTASHT